MPRFRYLTAASLDGFIADEHHSLQWLFDTESTSETQAALEAFQREIGVMVEGSSTYEWVLREEDLLAQPEKWQGFYGDRPTFVFTSRTLPVPEGADVRFVSGAVADALPAVVEAAGDRDVWIAGGGELVGQFADAGALDEVVVSIAPVTLGGGAPLLSRRLDLELADVERHGQFVHATFRMR